MKSFHITNIFQRLNCIVSMHKHKCSRRNSNEAAKASRAVRQWGSEALLCAHAYSAHFHLCTQLYIHIYTHTYVQQLINTPSDTDFHAYTNIHTYVHMQKQADNGSWQQRQDSVWLQIKCSEKCVKKNSKK